MGALIRKLLPVVLLASCALHAAQSGPGAPPQPSARSPVVLLPVRKIPHVSRAPKIEDFLTHAPREAELEVSGFRQFRPGDGTLASQPTTAYLSYDDKNLYVVFVCRDLPGQTRAHLAKREDIGNDDQVAVYLDTFHDHHRAYIFAVNPLGVQLDGIFTEGQGNDFSFDTLWYSEGRLTEDGYIVWMAIPFKSLRFPGEPIQNWGIALNRVILRKDEIVWWPYITQRVQGLTQQFADLPGLENISPARNIQLIPYGILARSRFLDQSDRTNPLFRTQYEHRAGLDAKFVVRDALTFDVTLNPDFSQVESDEPQVTVNQRFEVFFPERRPFFIENAAFFQTPINLFFSRRVADPQFGARMTGKVGKWTLGAMTIDDRQPGRGQPDGGPFDTRAAIGVVRIAREFGQQSQIGAFFSSRDFADSSNRVASLDTRIKFARNWVLDAQAVHSWTRQTNARLCPSPDVHLQGNAFLTQLRYAGRHLAASTSYDDKSPNFCTELGFVQRTDIRQMKHFVGYFWRPERGRILAFGPSVNGLVNWNRQGRIQDWEGDWGFEVQWARQTSINLSRGEAFELFRNLGFRKHSTAIAFTSEPYNWLILNARFNFGTNENFFPAAPLAPFLANSKRLFFGFGLRPQPRLRFDQTYIFLRLGTRGASTPAGFAPGTSIFNNHILRSKLNYQFTKELSLRAIFDYNATLANDRLVDVQTNLGSFPGGPVAPTKRFSSDLLFTYLLHPGTAVFFGYTDRYANLDIDRSLPFPVFRGGSPSTSTGRQFFVKMSYLFRF